MAINNISNVLIEQKELLEFKKRYLEKYPNLPEIHYSDMLRICKETKKYSYDPSQAIKKIIKVIIETVRKIMCLSICHESTIEDRRKMYNDALHECLKYKNMAKFSEYKKMKSLTMTKTIAIADSIGIAGGGAVGGGFGAIVGGPIGAAIGTAFGIFVGALTGTITSGIVISENFKKWKKTIDSDKFIKKLIEFHKDHSELSDFICMFSGNLIVDPVVTPSGHIYEREWITLWINDKEEELKHKTKPDWSVTDPYRNGRLTVNDLKTDYMTLARMKSVYSRLLADDIKLKEIPKPIKDALMAIKKDIDKQIELGLEIIKHNYFNDFKRKKITKEECILFEAERMRVKLELDDFINP